MTTVLIMAGGTGGHVYPALAVAQALIAQGVRVVWLGSRAGLEATVVPAAGIEMEWLEIKGLVGTSWRRKLAMPVMLLRALWQAAMVVHRCLPAVLLGMGGFVAGPGGLAGWLLRRPLLIHEANARAGLTNRLLGPFATRVMCGFEHTAGLGRDPVWTGNPVRPAIAALPAPVTRGVGRAPQLRVLVLGGSQGAVVLNQVLPAAVQQIPQVERPVLLHQSGGGRAQALCGAYAEAGVEAQVVEFIDDMARAYGETDVIVSRAGAMTVSEICAAGVAAILLPYPFAAGDHQSANAAFLTTSGAAVAISAAEVTPGRVAREIMRLAVDRAQVLQMAQSARRLARPEATERVTQQCLKAAHA